MAQGAHKLGKGKPKKSSGAQRRKAVRTVKKKRKGGTKLEHNKEILATTKAINKKNERIIAAKAMNGGTAFFMKEVAEKGKNVGLYCLEYRSILIYYVGFRQEWVQATKFNSWQEAE